MNFPTKLYFSEGEKERSLCTVFFTKMILSLDLVKLHNKDWGLGPYGVGSSPANPQGHV